MTDAVDQKQFEEAASLSPTLIHEVIRKDGLHELERPFNSLFWSGVAAGILISFSIVGKAMFAVFLPDASWAPLVENFGYSFGFLLVILGRMQLFTENTITTVLPVMAERSGAILVKMLRLWGLVLGANLIGCFIAAAAIVYIGVLPNTLYEEFATLSAKAMALGAGESLVLGIPAGILIAALVWMLPQAAASGFWVILLFTWLIGVCGFTHVVAGSVEMAFAFLTGTISIVDALFGFLLPVLTGNVIGGTLIFAFLAWAQVKEEIEDQ